jgi:diguanylate cyclase (GGDEF)-like protein/PAS domain S-box-containing protein
VRKRAWYLYLAGGLALSLLYYVGPRFMRTGPVMNIIGGSAAVAILVGVRLNKPRVSTAWYLFCGGLVLFVSGDVITYNYQRFFGEAAPFPSIGDKLYLAVYPVLIAGLIVLVRSRNPGRDRPALIDALVISIGVGVLSWVFLMAPNASNSELGLAQKVTSIAYPLGDLLLGGMILRLAVGRGSRTPAFYLLIGSVVALLLTDSKYTYIIITSTYNGSGSGLDLGWQLFYLLWGAAALHPSMRSLSEPGKESLDRLQRTRLVLLSAATLMVPIVRTIQLIRGSRPDEPVLIAAAVVIYLLVAARMSGLVVRHEQAERRERALREVGAAFVAAGDADDIRAAAASAIGEVSDQDVHARIDLAPNSGGSSPTLDGLTDVAASDLAGGRTISLTGVEPALAAALHLDPPPKALLLSPVRRGSTTVGLAVVSSETPLASQTVQAVEGLLAQASLALERAQLAEDVHRQRVEARFRSLVQNATDLITVIDADATIRYQSPSVRRVLGYEPSELEGTSFFDLIHLDDASRVRSLLVASGAGQTVIDARLRHHSGTWLAVEMTPNDLTDDPNVAGIVLNTRDVSERRAFEEQLQHQAFHDTVTGLANRALFHDRVHHALERQERDGEALAVLLLDLDDFKAVNDSLGHAVGDRLLVEVGNRLRTLVRGADTVARMGGDEFAVLMEEAREEEAGEAAERIVEGLKAAFQLDGKDVLVRASLGIAIVEGAGGEEGAEEVLRNADVAMYMAKAEGKGRYQIFEPTMHNSVLRRLELRADLLRAAENDEFVLYYQPIYDLAGGELAGVEALIRWQHPERGLVPPDQFIPLAEETGLIVPIGKWALEEACKEALILQRACPRSERPLTMAVNLSAKQLQEPDLVHDLATILRETGLAPQSLHVEITESVMMADTEFSVTRLKELKMLGVRLAVDDFGTGYSSLNYIRRFPIDVLKIDRSFIDGVSDGGEVSALTEAILQLSRILRLDAVAEGIETKEQLERLLELHCELGQGYLFARPLERKAIEALVASGRSIRVQQEEAM